MGKQTTFAALFTWVGESDRNGGISRRANPNAPGAFRQVALAKAGPKAAKKKAPWVRGLVGDRGRHARPKWGVSHNGMCQGKLLDLRENYLGLVVNVANLW